MWMEVDKQKLLIPAELFDKIMGFIDEHLAPIVFDAEKTYADCYNDELGFYNDNGAWVGRDKEASKKIILYFYLKNGEIESELDEFAMKEFQPYLM